MKAEEIPAELLEIERRYAARVFAGWAEEEDQEPIEPDMQAALAGLKFITAMALDEGERLISIWEVDEQYVLVASWAPGEQDPTHQGMVLQDWA